MVILFQKILNEVKSPKFHPFFTQILLEQITLGYQFIKLKDEFNWRTFRNEKNFDLDDINSKIDSDKNLPIIKEYLETGRSENKNHDFIMSSNT